MSSQKNPGGDDRFLKVNKDPRFWEMPEREHKIKIDKRFQSMFHEERFKVKYTVDKRGRPVNHTTREDLRRFYNLSDSEEEDAKDKKEVAEGKKKKKKKKKGKEKSEGGDEVAVEAEKLQGRGKAVQSSDGGLGGEQPVRAVRVSEKDDDDDEEEEEEQQIIDEDDVDTGDSIKDGSEEDEEDDDDENEDNDTGAESELESGSDAESGSESSEEEEDSDSEPDLARGMGNVETSSDEDEVDVILRREEEEIEHDWGELCKDATRNDEVSARLAVCNMDWDRMKAKDLLALVNSFKPKGGVVLSVKIYPSEFGKERLALEQTQCPVELMALPDDPDQDTKEERVYREKMRDYQFKRLKYYYAVVECDSRDTAVKIYEECDGFEYESSCSVMDLRFIPDDVTFDDEPKDVATDVDLSAYTPKLFTSHAAALSSVEVTWDETDHDRVTALNRKFNKDEILEMDFNAYLASSSEDDDGGGDEGGFAFGEPEEGKDEETSDAKQTQEAAVEEVKRPKEKKKKKSSEQISKYREILKSIQDKGKEKQQDKDMEMEITWVPGLKETTEQLVKKKLEGKDKLTPWEEFLEKKKDKKKQKKAKRKQGSAESDQSDDELPADVDLNDPFFAEELGSTADVKKKTRGKNNKKAEEERTPEEEEELEKRKAEMALLMDDEDDTKHQHFNYDRIVEQQNLSKKKRKKLLKTNKAVEDDDFQVDVKDPRFQAMFTSHLYNLDPSDPNYKKTKATQSILAEKQRRREEQEATPTQDTQSRKQEIRVKKQETDSAGSTAAVETSSKKAMDPSLSMLIKSIKNKTEQFQARKKPKLV